MDARERCFKLSPDKINKSNYDTAVKIASIPDQIRGFGHVKEKNIKEAINNRTDLQNSFHENT